jgi:hypothetical protein
VNPQNLTYNNYHNSSVCRLQQCPLIPSSHPELTFHSCDNCQETRDSRFNSHLYRFLVIIPSQSWTHLTTTVSRSVYPGVQPQSGTYGNFFFSLPFKLHLDIAANLSCELPPLREPGSCNCIPQEQGGPMIPSGIWFPFCRLLWYAGLQYSYSFPPPQCYS